MTKHNLIKTTKGAAVALCSMALCATLAGCSTFSTTTTNTNTPQAANRAYMSQVNSIMSELGDDLDGFTDAVSREDMVSIKTQCDKALKQLDELDKLEATDDLKDVKEKYDAAVDSLKAALSQYVDLYTSGSEVTQEALTDIQAQYDAGVTALSEADKLAASKS